MGRLAEGRRRAAQINRPVLVSAAHELPEPADMTGLYASAGRLGWHRSLWTRPSEGWWAVGAGRAVSLEGSGQERLAQVRRAHEALMDDAVVDAPALQGVGPLCFGGARFDSESPMSVPWSGYGDALFVLPRIAVSQSSRGSWVTTNVLVDADADLEGLEAALEADLGMLSAPSFGEPRMSRPIGSQSSSGVEWRRTVQSALELIGRKELAKVVLARRLHLRFDGPIPQEAVIRQLASAYPGCLVFAMGQGETAFLGATPEMLVDLHQGQVRVNCLAGSAPRGATVESDEVLGRALLEDAKDLREHSLTVQAVEQRLAELCTAVQRDPAPSLAKLQTVQHLATTLTASTPERRHVLDMVEGLHPTPAVGGTPSDAARRTIRELERMDRGWYAGPVGWVDPSGDGQFGVAIRSALVQGDEAFLYAGSGIVEGSDPEKELEETELKLGPLREALTGTSPD